MSLCRRVLSTIHTSKMETDELGKAKKFALFSVARPHMRSFHASWFCFFMAFLSWFGIQPLLPSIRKELRLSRIDLANSGIASVAGPIIVTVIAGPLCDKFGPRRSMSILLISGAIPMVLAVLIKDGIGLIIVRLFIGILGATFVPGQLWAGAMFSPEIVGTANGLVGGWGNLGGGIAFLLMPGLFQLMQIIGTDEFLAWKIAIVIPSGICILLGISILCTTDDCPQGDWSKRLSEEITITVEPNGISNLAFDSTLEKDLIEKNGVGGMNHTTLKTGKAERHSISETVKDPIARNGHGVVIPRTESTTNGTVGTKLSTIDNRLTMGLGNKYSVSEVEHCNGVSKELKLDMPASSENDTKKCTADTFWAAITVVILTVQYGMCFGVELAVNTVINLYFLYQFKKDGCVEGQLFNATNLTTPSPEEFEDFNPCSILSMDTASLISSLFGLMNLFARALGGIYSDVFRNIFDSTGRIIAQCTALLGQGVMLIIFSQLTSIPAAIGTLVIFSTFVQISEGTTFAITPYVSRTHVATVAGIVGAGGNAGAIIWNVLWVEFVDTNPSGWFWVLGIIVLIGSGLSVFLVVEKQRIYHIFPQCRPKKEDTPEVTKF